MKVILDSSFIISCVKRKIDFISELEEKGFEVLLAKEVLQELKDLRLNVSHDERKAIDIAEEFFRKRKFKKIALGQDRVDVGLIHKGKSGYYIATLDAAIKREVQNRVTINNAKNGIQIERD